MQESVLIRILHPPESLIKKFSEKHAEFYFEYAKVVAETLRWPLFQRFLDWVIGEENVNKNEVRDIRVIVFPSKNKRGKRLAGRCSKRGRISVYPKGIRSLLRLFMKNEKEKLDFYLKKRAISTVIHELLHIKYLSDEKRVRELTKNYLDTFDLRRIKMWSENQRHVKHLNISSRA